MSTINTVTGKKYRILKDAVNKVWDTISFWTASTDVSFEDGMTAEQKIGDVKGLVSTPQTIPGYIMDASMIAPIYKVLNGVVRPDGALTMTFMDPLITTTAKIQLYTDKYGYVPENMVVSGNTLTITFPQPENLVQVRVELGEFSGQ